MAQSASTIPLSPRARAAWRRAADELLIDAIFGDRVFGERLPDTHAPVTALAVAPPATKTVQAYG